MTSKPPFAYRELRGEEIRPWLDALGRLRIEVFREYPYLYDGNLAYERDYLETYAASPRSLVVLLEAENRLAGATTCIPMADEAAEFQEPFRAQGFDLDQLFYLGESVILSEFRGRGAGHRFIALRERHAQDLGGFRFTAFCAVDRPHDHPARPEGYRPLHDFWRRMGYAPRPELKCRLAWKEIGEAEESPKTLTFWLKEWT